MYATCQPDHVSTLFIPPFSNRSPAYNVRMQRATRMKHTFRDTTVDLT